MDGVIDARERWARRGIGAKLRLARLERGLSEAELGHKTGVPEDDIRDYELGKRPIGARPLEALARVLGLSIPELLSASGHNGGDLPSSEELLRLLQTVIALPSPLRTELFRFVDALGNW